MFSSLVKSYASQRATKEKPTGVEEVDMAAEAAKATGEPAEGVEEGVSIVQRAAISAAGAADRRLHKQSNVSRREKIIFN
jgi:hypothetical protein